ncbi:hypothetical protein MRI28_17170 [Nocardiopsis dassonvillei]|uniref:hypothetical protein n=1 Tax=Nocardiopsis dassonvillei TaxID=2014 RepID=UPI00200DC466|nr:hypothetical protein [Nocardiopsis dassonvillei]MCK9871347.1 hypothetical protein [Nocardiopsis dassonvillei]
MGGVLTALASVRQDLGERAEVAIDLLPVTPARVAHLIRRAHRSGHAGGAVARGVSAAASVLAELLNEVLPGPPVSPRGTAPPLDSSAPSATTKLTHEEPVFHAQVLIRVTSEIPGRAEAHLHHILASFEAFAGHNYWRTAGINLGFVHVGSDVWPWRWRFDRRMDTGLFAPRGDNLLTGRELAWALKPPTRHYHGHNVARSHGLVAPPPSNLPTYRGQRDVLPLGYTTAGEGGERLVGTPLEDLYFSLRIGRSRYGKTETALVQAIALALGGHGVWYLDPHADGWHRAAPMLTSSQVLERLWEVDLTVRGDQHRIAGYNPLDMSGPGLGREHIEDRVDAIVTGFASALHWTDTASRARTILTRACETLCYLGLRLPREHQPTLFQIPRLLNDESWRDPLLRFLPTNLQRFWSDTFPRYPSDSTPTVTNIVERLASSRTLRAFFGSPTTYDVRRAMDEAKVVFVCPPGGDLGRLVNCLLVWDLFRAGRSRADIPAHDRRRYDVYVDELTVIDGASRGHLASILEQLGKFEVRLHAMTQMAQRLTRATRDALLQNQSLLSTTAGEVDAVRVVTRQWAGEVQPEMLVNLPRFHHVLTTTIGGQVTPPFKVRGALVDELFAAQFAPERLPDQQHAIDANLARRTIGEVLSDLETLDERIHLHLGVGSGGSHRSGAGAEPGQGGAGKRSHDGGPGPGEELTAGEEKFL